jgi:ABC-type transporter Mla subunit MlaD
MPLPHGEAAKAGRRDKTTLLRAIKAGKLSAVRDAATGGWQIEPAELHRVYPALADAAVATVADAAKHIGEAEIEIRELRARLADSQDQVVDLRRRLDTATEQLGEALQQVRQLTDQRTAPAATPPALQKHRRWWHW